MQAPEDLFCVCVCVLVRWALVVRDGSVRQPATVSRCRKAGPKVWFLSSSPPRAPLEERGPALGLGLELELGLGLTRERWQQHTGGRVVQVLAGGAE